LKLGANHPIGPLALADLIGIDTCLNIMSQFYEKFKDKKYMPCPLFNRMVDEGNLGRKTGRGFFIY
jgi:3-hydroxybutyryl-CoA dehydrogenase